MAELLVCAPYKNSKSIFVDSESELSKTIQRVLEHFREEIKPQYYQLFKNVDIYCAKGSTTEAFFDVNEEPKKIIIYEGLIKTIKYYIHMRLLQELFLDAFGEEYAEEFSDAANLNLICSQTKKEYYIEIENMLGGQSKLLAEEITSVAIYFVLAHEMSHILDQSKNKTSDFLEQEFDADRFAILSLKNPKLYFACFVYFLGAFLTIEGFDIKKDTHYHPSVVDRLERICAVLLSQEGNNELDEQIKHTTETETRAFKSIQNRIKSKNEKLYETAFQAMTPEEAYAILKKYKDFITKDGGYLEKPLDL